MKYPIVLADPPWSYANKRTGGSMASGASNVYDTLVNDDIAALAVSDVAAPDAVLLLWATVPLLPAALDVMARWGFAYKTALAWDKARYGMGFWLRGQFELLLVGVRGKPQPWRSSARNVVVAQAPDEDGLVDLSNDFVFENFAVDELLHFERTDFMLREKSTFHSRKPTAVYEILNAVRRGRPALELFARAPVPDWIDATGLELDGLDARDAIQRIAAAPDRGWARAAARPAPEENTA